MKQGPKSVLDDEEILDLKLKVNKIVYWQMISENIKEELKRERTA